MVTQRRDRVECWSVSGDGLIELSAGQSLHRKDLIELSAGMVTTEKIYRAECWQRLHGSLIEMSAGKLESLLWEILDRN